MSVSGCRLLLTRESFSSTDDFKSSRMETVVSSKEPVKLSVETILCPCIPCVAARAKVPKKDWPQLFSRERIRRRKTI